ncbi:hypothetical protein ABIF90_003247 [Bradyrhizobium japonicum]
MAMRTLTTNADRIVGNASDDATNGTSAALNLA